MIISRKSQLGLMLLDKQMLLRLKQILVDTLKKDIAYTEKMLSHIEKENKLTEEMLQMRDYSPGLSEKANQETASHKIARNQQNRTYLICESIYKAAALIRIERLDASIFSQVPEGEYTYLMGKSRFAAVSLRNGYAKSIFYDVSENVAFEWHAGIEEKRFCYPLSVKRYFEEFFRILIFVEMGDVETVFIEKGCSNKASRKEGKIKNDTPNDIYVVDSTWNRLLIRTEGFAVRGHFRLQAHGPGHSKRKLTWIDAFEKHGYVRKPRAKAEKPPAH